MRLIGLAGKKRCGKDTIADHLVNNYGFTRVSFAQPIKDMVSAMMDVSEENIEKFGREKIIPELGVTYRYLWQTIGTEWGRDLINKDIWLILAKLKIGKLNKVVISDVRFDNEANFVRENNGIIWNIHRSLFTYDDVHLSEAGIQTRPIDEDIYNGSTIESLLDKVDERLNLSKYSIPNI